MQYVKISRMIRAKMILHLVLVSFLNINGDVKLYLKIYCYFAKFQGSLQATFLF